MEAQDKAEEIVTEFKHLLMHPSDRMSVAFKIKEAIINEREECIKIAKKMIDRRNRGFWGDACLSIAKKIQSRNT